MRIAAVVVLVLLSPFILGFVWAAVSSALGITKKSDRANAIVVLARLSPDAMELLLAIFRAFTQQDVGQANRLVANAKNWVDEITARFPLRRDRRQSAGAIGDELNKIVWQTDLNGQGYSEAAARIIASVYHHYLDGVLTELVNKGPADSSKR